MVIITPPPSPIPTPHTPVGEKWGAGEREVICTLNNGTTSKTSSISLLWGDMHNGTVKLQENINRLSVKSLLQFYFVTFTVKK